MSELGLSISGVAKEYSNGVRALDGVDLAVERGEICALLGENGAGKSTLVSIVAGLRTPDSGEVSVCGVDVIRHPEEARTFIGLAPQELGIYPSLRVRENLQFFGELAGVGRRKLAERIEEVASTLALTELLERKARALSGGEKRRLHTACALLHQPAVLLLDEPTAGLDVRSRAAVIEAVRGFAAAGAAVCYSTHYMQEVEELDASVAILERGRIVAEGTVGSLVAAHGRSWVEFEFAAAQKSSPVIDIDQPFEWTDDRTLRILTDGMEPELMQLLAQVGPSGQQIRRVDVVRPSIESVFLALTGRRYESAEGAV
jgi:ABC-2 type transport system ATP-binding protein